MSLIKIDSIWFDYTPESKTKSDWLLRDLNLSIDEGEYLTIVGLNGSGKSTLAKLINGLLLPIEGNIHVSEWCTTDCSNIVHIRQKVGVVFQNPDNQIVGTTVEEDIAFGLENLGVPRQEMERRIVTILDEIGLRERKDDEPHHLSGGQKQKLAIASVLVMDPQVIIFDESTSMLDPKGKNELLTIMRQLQQQGKTIIHITHSTYEALRADRIVVMSQGQVKIDVLSSQLYAITPLLEKWGIEIPIAAKLYQRLKDHGWNLQDIATSEDLVEEVWRLVSKE